MAIRQELCATCFYFEDAEWCVRFPAAVAKSGNGWCGEHQRDAGRICNAEGPVIAPSSTEKILRETFDLTRKLEGASPLPPRKPSHEKCLRTKGHEGKHANYRQEWE